MRRIRSDQAAGNGNSVGTDRFVVLAPAIVPDDDFGGLRAEVAAGAARWQIQRLRSSAKLGIENNVVREMTPLQIEQLLGFLTTFCVFPLTGFLHPTILRFQIRGTWKRQTDRSRMLTGVRTGHDTSRVLSKKIEREDPASRRTWTTVNPLHGLVTA
jgi:hypothetical protein